MALDLGIEAGGWCPRGRRAEDGAIDERYPLAETPRRRYIQRTDWNVRDSDGTLIVAREPLSGGSAATRRLARRRGKPCLIAHPEDCGAAQAVRAWLREHAIAALNVAGPRQSAGGDPYGAAERLLRSVLQER